jgi:hypothetical protein
VFNDYAGRIDRLATAGRVEQAFKGVRAGGVTNPGAALSLALRDGYMPEQIVFVTDGGEHWSVADQIAVYQEKTGIEMRGDLTCGSNAGSMSTTLNAVVCATRSSSSTGVIITSSIR